MKTSNSPKLPKSDPVDLVFEVKGTPSQVLTLHLTRSGNLLGETVADDQLVRELIPAREGDLVGRRGPGPERSNLETLITRCAVAKIMLIIRSDLPPAAE